MSITTFEKILHSKKIRYEILNKILSPIIPPAHEMKSKYNDTVNIFINIYSLYNSLYNPELVELFKSLNREEKYMLSSDIANMCGHYRHYFADRRKLYTNIYLYYSDLPATYQIEKDSNYRKEFYEKRFGKSETFENLNKIFQINLKILNNIVTYLPHIYLLNSEYIDYNIIPMIILKDIKKRKEQFNIFITNDQIELQYYKYGYILFPKGDKSYILDSFNHNLVDELSSAKILNKDLEFYEMIAKNFLPEIFSLSGYKKYNISSVGKFTNLKSLRLIHDFIKTKKEKDRLSIAEENKLSRLIEILYNNGKINIKDIEKIKLNNQLLDLENIYTNMEKIIIRKIKNQMEDIIDTKALREINDKYYQNYPLYFHYILEGENYN